MSKFSTIYDQIRAVIPTLSGFSAKTEIANPYSLPDNPEMFIEDSWGLRVDTSTPGRLDIICNQIFELRTFSILLTKKLYSLQNDNDQLHLTVKAMMEDVVTLRKSFEDFDQLGIEASIEKIDFSTNNGIQYFYKDDISYLVTQTNFNIEISEEN